MRFPLLGAGLLMLPALLMPGLTRSPAQAQAACSRGTLNFSSWRIPGTDGRSGWWPVGVDGNRVVMVREPSGLIDTARRLKMALVTAGSTRYRPIPAGAYPHAGMLQRWQFSWPWIVGVFTPTDRVTPAWTLWAGNVQTGKHIVLDRGHDITTTGSNRGFPDFDLSGNRVVWTWSSYFLRRPITHNRIALYDLAAHHLSFLPIPVSTRLYGHPTLWGTRIVWERYTPFPCIRTRCPPELIDLQLYDLATHRLQTLTHSSRVTGNSFSPGLWRDDLVFLRGPQDAQSGGSLIMVDLASRVSGTHRFWWQGYRYRVLERRMSIELDVRDGLVSWDGGVADLVSGRAASLPWGEGQWSGGRSLVVQRIPPSGPAPYTLLQVAPGCHA